MELSVGTSESGVGVAPVALSGCWIGGHRAFRNIVTMFAVPFLELPFPNSGLSPGVDVEEVTGEAEKLYAGSCFRVQGKLGLDVEPSMKPAALDNCLWPQSF